MWRWLGILVVIGLMLGCAEMWDDVADFFDSGFADDDGGDGGGGDELTTENLEGSWELDLEASTIDDDTRLTAGNLIGTWNVSELPDGFLAVFEPTIDTATAVIITENTFTFRTEDAEDTDPEIDYDIIDIDTVELTDEGTMREVQVALTTTGTTTAMTITDGTDAATFTFDGTHTTITSYDLSITETRFTSTITRSNNTTETIIETYEILDDDESIQLTREVTNEDTVVEAALRSDGDRLTLTYPDEAGGGTAVFDRIGGGNADEDDDPDDPDDPDNPNDPDDDDDLPPMVP